MNRRPRIRASLLASSLVLIVPSACGGGETPKPAQGGGSPAAAAVVISDADRAAAKQTFETVCFTCHGVSGKGDGPGSAGLDPKPRDLSDKTWQASIGDEHLRNVITMGGPAVGKSPAMPPQPQLKGNPKQLEALIQHVRGLAR